MIQALNSLPLGESVAAGRTAAEQLLGAGKADKPAAPSFQDVLTQFVRQTDRAQKAADVSMQHVVSGHPASLQSAVLNLEEADLAFRLMKEVRDKLLTAYKEIISTQV